MWKGSGSDSELYYSSSDGYTWASQAQIYNSGTSADPAITVFNGQLYAMWKGSGSDQGVYYDSGDGSTWAAQTQVTNVDTNAGPAIAAFNGQLYDLLKGPNTNNVLYWASGAWTPAGFQPLQALLVLSLRRSFPQVS